MDYLDLLQWPAMAATIVAAWFVASQSPHRRKHGFWWYLSGNALWIVWGWQADAWALVLLQVALASLNIRGSRKNERQAEAEA